ncbi:MULTISPECIES: ABC transporter ATP-binding protein [Bacillaceae]|uniref:ABC transporter ATP-binding protein n=1 Tax=Evansella alkalicola TaxID=745819 RepID=A0ABS6JZH5_9BACI|nr:MULTISPECIES: ABC transporter ATP-binding protein [Bacillaceae]MBU9723873.1 ABC transporter ATP-binding protein [Bacillus alkalicola]
MAELKGVTKVFKGKKAVDDLNFSIRKGEITAILGPNGAGKSTTIKMLLGLLEPSTGSVRVFNQKPKEKKVLERIGAMLQEVSVIDALTVKEILQLFRSYYPKPLPYEELVTITGFTKEELKKRAEKLSAGQKRRLAFALALAGDPDLLFFDEPTVGMDVTSRSLFWKTIDDLKARGKTIIFTTHYLQEADDVAERIILFHNGAVIEDGTPAEIKSRLTKKAVTFKHFGQKEAVFALKKLPIVSKVIANGDRFIVETSDTDALLRILFERQLPVKEIDIEQGRLEDAFERLTVKEEVI